MAAPATTPTTAQQATRRRHGSEQVLAAGFLLALALGTWLRVRLLLGGALDYDEGVYWQSLRALRSGHGLFGSVYSSQPPGFLALMAPVARLVSHSIVPARLEVLAISLLGCLAATGLVWRRFGPAGALLTFTLLAVDPLIVHESVTLQADSPATALGLVAVWLSDTSSGARGRKRDAWAALAGATLALAVLVKLFALVFAVAITVILVRGGGRRPGWRDLAERLGSAAIGACVVTAALLLPFVGVWGDLWNQVVAGHLTDVARIEAAVGGIPTSAIDREAPLLAVGALGLAAAARLRPRGAILLTALAVPPVAFLLISRPIFPHHLVLAAMPLTACAAPLAAISRRPRSRVRLVGMGATAAAVAVLLIVSLNVTPAPLQMANNTAAAIDRAVPAADLVITDDQFTLAMADRSTPAQLVDTSTARILSGLLNSATVERIVTRDHVNAVIFASGRLARLPGLHDWVARRFPHAEGLPDGSVMYIRQARPDA
jgi:4-amino-4-deoxy-L-arabinose transferase-like glycosyltransferase